MPFEIVEREGPRTPDWDRHHDPTGEQRRAFVLSEIQLWAYQHGGKAPTHADWNKAVARRRNIRFERGWPSVTMAIDHFGSWGAALTAAGFEARRPGRQPARAKVPPVISEEAATHRRRLAETIRRSQRWRERLGREAAHGPIAAKTSFRAAVALAAAARFVDCMDEDDPDMFVLRRSEIADSGEYYVVDPTTLDLLGRFGMNRGAWVGRSVPDEDQIRNFLRRLEGGEQAARAAENRELR